MITKDHAKLLNASLNSTRKRIDKEYENIEEKFKDLLKENGKFEILDYFNDNYEVLYTGNEFPIECKVASVYLNTENEIKVSLFDSEFDEDSAFEVDIHDIETSSLYGDNILNLYGLAIDYFTEK